MHKYLLTTRASWALVGSRVKDVLGIRRPILTHERRASISEKAAGTHGLGRMVCAAAQQRSRRNETTHAEAIKKGKEQYYAGQIKSQSEGGPERPGQSPVGHGRSR